MNEMNNTNEVPAVSPAPADPVVPTPTPAAEPIPQVVTMDTAMKSPAPEKSESHIGAWIAIAIGVLIILTALALGAFYLWGAALSQNEVPAADATTEETATTTPTAAATDEISAIEASLNTDDLSAIDAELDAIDAEIQSGTSQ